MSLNTMKITHEYETLKEKLRKEMLSLRGIESIPLDHTIVNPDADWQDHLILGSQIKKINKDGEIHCVEMDGSHSIFDLIHVNFDDLLILHGQLKAFDLKFDLQELAWIKDENHLGFISDIRPHDHFYIINDKPYRADELLPVRLDFQLEQLVADGATYNEADADQINTYFD